VQKLKVLTFQQAVDEYLDFRKQSASAQSYKNEINYFRKFTDFFPPSSPIGEIKEKDAERLILKLRTSKPLPRSKYEKAADKLLRPQTILHHYGAYSRLFKYFIKSRAYIGNNPFNEDIRKLIPKINNEIVRYFDTEQNVMYVTALFQEYKDNKTQEFLRNTLGLYYASGLKTFGSVQS
jgi:hypothetical protein